MSFTHTTGVTYRTNAGTLQSSTDQLSADTEHNLQDSIGANGGVTHFVFPVDVSEIQSFAIYSDQDLTININSDGAPDQVLNLTGSRMLTWNVNRIDSNPLTADWTGIWVHNDTASAASLKMSFLINQPSGS